MLTRRQILALLAYAAAPASTTLEARSRRQGVSTRGVKATPRGKPSGRPFHSRFTDIAAQAGLPQPTVYGGVDAKQYIIEVVGCGAAFFAASRSSAPRARAEAYPWYAPA